MKKLLVTTVCIVFLVPYTCFSHPGRTDSSGCHTCRSKCSSWGLSTGQHHCHGGSSSAPSSSESYGESSSKSSIQTQKEENIYKWRDNKGVLNYRATPPSWWGDDNVIVAGYPDETATINKRQGATSSTNTVNYTQGVTVYRIIDGDTVDVLINGKKERLRLIGLNTPETKDPRKPVQCFGKEASKKAAELLPIGATVILEKDPTQSERDKYNRLLRYLWIDKNCFNYVMIREGYAFEYTYKTPYKYQQQFKEAQRLAESEKRGLWSDSACGGVLKPAK